MLVSSTVFLLFAHIFLPILDSDNIVTAAWEAGLGVHALIWVHSSLFQYRPASDSVSCFQFGFDGTDEWIGRRDSLLATLHSNPRAKFVTRLLQFGSEPLYDWVLDPDALAAQVVAAKRNLSDLGIPVTISEMA